MHSEHRHHLQQNELGQLTMQAVPWMERHGMQLIAAVAITLVALVGGAIWMSMSGAADTAAWSKLALATKVEEFGDVADRYPGTLAGSWAHLRMGELNLESGINAMFTDRELALKDLKAAGDSFDAVLKSSVPLPENVRERALLGQARVLEATCNGDTTQAIEAYQRLVTDYPKSIYKANAESRIAELNTGGAREFYTWFHSQKPAPAAFPRPQDGQSKAPELDPFALPPAAAPQQPAAETPAETATPAEAGSSTPEAEKATPATPAPEGDKPAEPAKPAEAASETPAPAAEATPQ